MKSAGDGRTISFGGLAFSISSSMPLFPSEEEFLSASDTREQTPGQALRITIAAEPPFDYSPSPSGSEPAAIECTESRIRIRHATFVAEISPGDNRATVHRRVESHGPLYIAIKTALACRLPLDGGLVLHSAGAVIDGRAFLFFGRSGAGKSTLSSLSPYPLLSDEHVVVMSRGEPAARASGCWGDFEGTLLPGSYPLGALIEIGRGSSFRLAEIGPSAAIRALIGVAQVQPLRDLWMPALSVVRRLVETTPVYHMEWAPNEEVWARIHEAIG